jgi:hypothetical protein
MRRQPNTIRVTIALTTALYGLMPTGAMAQYFNQIPYPAPTVQPASNYDACVRSASRVPDSQRAAVLRKCNRLARPQHQPQGGQQTCEAMRWSAPGANPAIVCGGGGAQPADGPARQVFY